MDAPTLTSESRRELAELRSRAYGPDADIHRDADALARLIELEDIARADAPAAASDPGAPAAAAAASGSVAAAAPRPTGDEAPVEEAESGGDTQVRRHWWRRVPVAALVGVAALVSLALGLVLPGLGAPRPVATLQQAPIDGAELDFEMYGIQSDSPVRYEPYRDLEVWSAQTEQGSTCIVVTTATSEWMAAGCAPAPLDPVADITFYTEMRKVDGLDLPPGSIVRFILRDGVMEVWMAETAQGA